MQLSERGVQRNADFHAALAEPPSLETVDLSPMPEPMAIGEAFPLPPLNEAHEVTADRTRIEDHPVEIKPTPFLARTRASRLASESHPPSDHPIHKFMNRKLVGVVPISDIALWALELSPVRFIWGPGDALSLYMALKRKNPLTGEHIDEHEARLCFIAAVIPLVPSQAILGPARMIRHALEEGDHALRTGDLTQIKKAITPRNALKLALAVI